MTVETTERLVVYRGNGSATNWPYNFQIPQASQASVNIQDYATGTILETLSPGAYQLNGVGDPEGGSVDYPIDASAPLDDTKQIVIIRTVEYTQELNISNQGGFHPETLEAELDAIVMQIQQIAEQQTRSLIVNPGQEVPDLTAIAAAEYWAGVAEDEADRAEGYANLALNSWNHITGIGNGIVTDIPLSANPGSTANVIVNFDGILQMKATYSLVDILGVTNIRFTSPIPDGVPYDIDYGNRTDLAATVIPDLSIVTSKYADGSVTFPKLTLSAADMQALLPPGSLVDSKSAVYTANANLTAVIPADDTIPQITEGTEIITTTYTMKSVTNILRLRFNAVGAYATNGLIIAGIFIAGDANAKVTGVTSVSGVDVFLHTLTCAVDLVPGVLTSLTISVRVGPNGAGAVRLNGNTSGRFFGGSLKSTLLIEEIKA